MKLVYNSNSFTEKKAKPSMNTIEDLLFQINQLTNRVKQLEVDLAWSQKHSNVN